jgi:ferric-dicitrate binding protein FerR (iron transport regulator)
LSDGQQFHQYQQKSPLTVEGGQYLVKVEGGQYLVEVEGGQCLVEVEGGDFC